MIMLRTSSSSSLGAKSSSTDIVSVAAQFLAWLCRGQRRVLSGVNNRSVRGVNNSPPPP